MSNGQMLEDIVLAIGCIRPVELVNRMGGNLVDVENITQKIIEVAGGE
jgi:2-oxoisovalerate ferredoxin oxidoreductase alpha subunit